MAENPYAGTAFEASWQDGFNAGYADSHSEPEPPLILEPDQQTVFREGALAGREEARAAEPVEIPGSELITDLGVHALLHHLYHDIGGIVAFTLSLESCNPPPDEELPETLETLPADWAGPGSDDAGFYAACPLAPGHDADESNIAPAGYWAGPRRDTFEQADNDRSAHEHSEAFVLRCSLSEGTCGPVVAGP